MNHSEAVLCRNIVKQQIRDLQNKIVQTKRDIAEDWEMSNPDTERGKMAFHWLNLGRDDLRKAKRELKALELLSKHLKHVGKAENMIAGFSWFVEEITDEDYRIFED